MAINKHLKARARITWDNALAYGHVIRPQACESCHGPNPQGHHPDYAKPLEVMWLCRRCHGAEHHKENAATRQAQKEVGANLSRQSWW